MSNLQYNERSWGIDLISEINAYCLALKRPIVRAGGEHSLKERKATSLYPDVLLFGDTDGALVRHGWELKFPDTLPDEKEVIDNAVIKASRLNVDSFLSWNVNKAILFRKDGSGHFSKYKEWDAIGVTKRTDVQAASAQWKKLLHEIIDDLNDFFDAGELKSSMPQDVMGERLFVEFIERFSGSTKDSLLLKANEDAEFEAEIESWWILNKAEYSKDDKLSKDDKFKPLSSVLITGWLNKFIFAHCLKKFYTAARKVDKIDISLSPADALLVFGEITKESDFLQVFTKDIGSEFIGEDAWGALCQFNALLVDYKLNEVPQEVLHAVIDAAAHGAKRKAAGQYSTPFPLAQYLVGITLRNRGDAVFDPCCGTGTIPKAAYALKRSKGISSKDALAKIWASDKFRFPLQLCTLALADPKGMGEVVHVFNSDVFNLKSGQSVSFIHPNNGGIVEEDLPVFPAIVSNLPFVRFEDVKKVNPDAERNLKEVYGDSSYSTLI